MHARCFATKLTTINTVGMELVLDEMQDASHTKLIDNFIKHSNVWSKILDRDYDFIYNQLPQMYESDMFDSNVIVVSLKCYDQLKSTNAPQPATWPVSEDDQKAIWVFFKNMVTLACRHVKENPSKYPKAKITHLITKYGINA